MSLRFRTESEGADKAVLVSISDDTWLFVLCDGVSGRFGAAAAAARVCQHFVSLNLTASEVSIARMRFELTRADDEICREPSCGETTCVVGYVTGEVMAGVSVGNTEVYNLGSGEIATLGQTRKPYVGSGNIKPSQFEVAYFGDLILVATDGTFLKNRTYDSFETAIDFLDQQTAVDDAGYILFEWSQETLLPNTEKP